MGSLAPSGRAKLVKVGPTLMLLSKMPMVGPPPGVEADCGDTQDLWECTANVRVDGTGGGSVVAASAANAR